jgi:hypothetical protein
LNQCSSRCRGVKQAGAYFNPNYALWVQDHPCARAVARLCGDEANAISASPDEGCLSLPIRYSHSEARGIAKGPSDERLPLRGGITHEQAAQAALGIGVHDQRYPLLIVLVDQREARAVPLRTEYRPHSARSV